MATVSLSAFLPLVLPSAPGLPVMTAELQLRLAAIEFCERTRCWRHMINLTFTDENHQVPVAPDYAAIHDFEFAVFASDSIQNRVLTPTQFSEIAPGGLTLYEGCAPEHISQITPNTVTIFPFAPGVVSLSVFLKPRHGQDFANAANTLPLQDYFNQVPDFLLTQWGEAIAAGALARALMMPQKQWTEMKLAAAHLARFERYCDQHFSHNIIRQQRAPRRTRSQFF